MPKGKSPRSRPLYKELGTLRDFVNRFFTLYLILNVLLLITPLFLVGFNSLSLIIIVLLILLLNAIYTGIQGKSEDAIGNWDCKSLMKRFLLGIIFPLYIIFSAAAIIAIIWYTTNLSNLFSFSSQTTNQNQEQRHYFQEGLGARVKTDGKPE